MKAISGRHATMLAHIAKYGATCRSKKYVKELSGLALLIAKALMGEPVKDKEALAAAEGMRRWVKTNGELSRRRPHERTR